MFTLCVKDSFAAAHRIENYHGKCEELHGHNFHVEAFFQSERVKEDGMVVDFKVLKNCLSEVLEAVDHKYINEIPFFRERASSSEYMAMYVFVEIRGRLKEDGVCLKEVRVWESEKSWAAYSE